MPRYQVENDSICVGGKLHGGLQAEKPGDAVLLNENGRIPAEFVGGTTGGKYGLAFDEDIFMTDPAGCLRYTEDLTGMEPVSNVGNQMHINGWEIGKGMLADCFYATVSGQGDILHILDPDNLSLDINGIDRSEEIRNENVMFVVPTRYINRNSRGITHSRSAKDGVPYAHTLDHKVHRFMALGVYTASEKDGKLMSVSGAAPAQQKTRPVFRTEAEANGENWHLMNFHEYALMRDMCLMALKSFDVQRNIGQGHSTGGSATVYSESGLLNDKGIFAGDVSATTKPVKCFLENFWGNRWQFVDDCVVDAARQIEDGSYVLDVYAGSNSVPNDSTTDGSKEVIGQIPVPSTDAISGQYATKICTEPKGWGLPAVHAGGDSVGLCDAHWLNGADKRVPLVGGNAHDGSGAGVSSMLACYALSDTLWYFGARLALTFD